MLDLESQTVQIASGTALSPAVKIGVKVMVGISFPPNWTNPTGGVSFQVSLDGGTTFQELFDGATGNAVNIPATGVPTGGSFVALSNIDQWAAVNVLKVRSGTSGSPVNQTNTVTLTLFYRTVGF